MTSGSAELELPDAFSQSRHTNNWAVLVDTSRSEIINKGHLCRMGSFWKMVNIIHILD